MGVLKAFFGLSASMIGIVHAAYFGHDAQGLLLFIGIASSLIIGVSTIFQSVIGGKAAEKAREEAARMNAEDAEKYVAKCIQLEEEQLALGPGGKLRVQSGYAFVVIVAIFVTTSAILQHFSVVSISGSQALAWCLVPLLLGALVFVLPIEAFEDTPMNPSIDQSANDVLKLPNRS